MLDGGRASSPREWRDYIGQFHDAKGGITEAVLGRSQAEGMTPYEWLGTNLAAGGRTIDLACGSAPMQRIIGPRWLGVDASEAELAVARAHHGVAAMCRADAAALPFRDRSADAALCCMGLMVISDVDAALRELVRVTPRGGKIAVVVPSGRPLLLRDRLRYARLLAVLHITKFRYPSPEVVRNPAQVLQRAGLAIIDDASRRFAFTIAGGAEANLLLDSLYLPHISSRRIDAAKQLTHRWLGTDLGIPLRRLTAELR